MRERSSGILMHISSLPGNYGIGDFGIGAYNFIDFLKESKQKYWQILPLGVTGYGDSPYQCFSSFGGNPYFIDLDEFIKKGYLDENIVQSTIFGQNQEKVDYGILYKNKIAILRLAYINSLPQIKEELTSFYKENKYWLREFALFMSLKSKFNHTPWYHWPMKYRDYNATIINDYEIENQEEIYFWIFTQYFFKKQWIELKAYSNNKNIKIIGDLPIYVSADSSDIWKNPYLFKMDDDLQIKKIAGVPPDYFSPRGQLWGNPIYDWDQMEKDNYKWWINRIKFSLNQVDTLRLDHFRAFASYWEIEPEAESAINGQWQKGPGIKLFERIREELEDLDIIVEDLGINSQDVEELVKLSGFPNMKVLQFGFDTVGESHHIPHRIEENSVAYTGTHDNPTSMAWLKTISQEQFNFVKRYLKLDLDEGMNWGFIRGAWSSNAYLAIAPMQDLLGLEEARMNIPGTTINNWSWRINEKALNNKLVKKIRNLTELYSR